MSVEASCVPRTLVEAQNEELPSKAPVPNWGTPATTSGKPETQVLDSFRSSDSSRIVETPRTPRSASHRAVARRLHVVALLLAS